MNWNILKPFYAIFALALVLSVSSCDLTDDFEAGGTQVEEMAGDWFIKIYQDEVADANLLSGSFFQLSTYNTAADLATEMFLDDHGTWPYKGVVSVNVNNLSFNAGMGGENSEDPTLTMEVVSGQIWKGVVTAESGTTTDSIQIRMKFSDFPDGDVIYSGYKRTGFPEDEH